MWEALIALRLEESEQEIRKMEGGRQEYRGKGEGQFEVTERRNF